MGLKIKVSSLFEQILLLIVFVLVFLYDAFVEFFGFLDELIALISFVVIFFFILKGKLRFFRKEYYIILFLGIIMIIGFLSNLLAYTNDHLTNLKAIFADFIIFFKAFVIYIAVRLLSDKFDARVVLIKIAKYARVVFYLLLAIIVFDIIFNYFPKESRYDFRSLKLFFKHGSRYAFAFAFIFLVLLPKHYKNNKALLFFVLIVGTFSLRVKFFGFIGLTLIIIFYGKRLFKIPKLYFLSFLGVLCLFLIWLFRFQIDLYFTFDSIDDAWSRAIILYYSFSIGNDFFPVGTGFGTYSSYYSGHYYSWVYDLYGISNVYGIKREYWNFVADQYWPMVLGQFGYLGLFSMAMVIYNYFTFFLDKIKANRNNENYYYFLTAILGLLMLLIDSTSDAIFTQQRAVVMFIYFALIVNTIDTKNESTSNK
nr:hypothetical protein [uncultured Psychroserpens sp.]